jgi:hypothetical protein
MDWLPWMWLYDACCGPIPDARLAERTSSTLGPTTLDRWLVEVIYRRSLPSRAAKSAEKLSAGGFWSCCPPNRIRSGPFG